MKTLFKSGGEESYDNTSRNSANLNNLVQQESVQPERKLSNHQLMQPPRNIQKQSSTGGTPIHTRNNIYQQQNVNRNFCYACQNPINGQVR